MFKTFKTDEMYPGRTILVDYLKEREPHLWSFLDFLTTNRNVIVNVPPYTEDQKGLNGAWTKRFLREVKELNPDSDDIIKVSLEHAQPDLTLFWQGVIIERLQRQVQRTYDLETLHTFNESVKFYGKKLRLPYNGQTKGATSSQCQFKSRGITQDNYELEEDEEDEEDEKYGNSVKKRSIKKVQVEKRSKRRNISQNTDHITTIDSTDMDEESDDSEIEDSCNRLDFTELDASYLAMDSEQMWKLKSGRKVEEIIYQHARKLHKESCLHSFIINDTDKNAKAIFSMEEWKEVFATDVQKKPEVEAPLLELIKKYTLDNVNDLRKSLLQPFLPDGAKFNRNLHYNLDFINYAYRGMLFLWEAENNFTSDQSKLEGWYQSNIWSRIIDPAFHDTKFELISGEGMSFASSDRKNDGGKGDGIFRITTDRMEFGAIETGRKWEGSNGTKYLKDSLKLNKMLKDMIVNLISESNCNIFRQLQVIGILNGGNRLQTIIMDTPRGYISRVKHGKFFEVSGRLSKLQPLGFVIKEILRAKATIVKTLDLINNDRLNNLFNDTDQHDDYDDVENKLKKPTFPTFSTPRISKTANKLKK